MPSHSALTPGERSITEIGDRKDDTIPEPKIQYCSNHHQPIEVPENSSDFPNNQVRLNIMPFELCINEESFNIATNNNVTHLNALKGTLQTMSEGQQAAMRRHIRSDILSFDARDSDLYFMPFRIQRENPRELPVPYPALPDNLYTEPLPHILPRRELPYIDSRGRYHYGRYYRNYRSRDLPPPF